MLYRWVKLTMANTVNAELELWLEQAPVTSDSRNYLSVLLVV